MKGKDEVRFEINHDQKQVLIDIYVNQALVLNLYISPEMANDISQLLINHTRAILDRSLLNQYMAYIKRYAERYGHYGADHTIEVGGEEYKIWFYDMDIFEKHMDTARMYEAMSASEMTKGTKLDEAILRARLLLKQREAG